MIISSTQTNLTLTRSLQPLVVSHGFQVWLWFPPIPILTAPNMLFIMKGLSSRHWGAMIREPEWCRLNIYFVVAPPARPCWPADLLMPSQAMPFLNLQHPLHQWCCGSRVIWLSIVLGLVTGDVFALAVMTTTTVCLIWRERTESSATQIHHWQWEHTQSNWNAMSSVDNKLNV